MLKTVSKIDNLSIQIIRKRVDAKNVNLMKIILFDPNFDQCYMPNAKFSEKTTGNPIITYWDELSSHITFCLWQQSSIKTFIVLLFKTCIDFIDLVIDEKGEISVVAKKILLCKKNIMWKSNKDSSVSFMFNLFPQRKTNSILQSRLTTF